MSKHDAPAPATDEPKPEVSINYYGDQDGAFSVDVTMTHGNHTATVTERGTNSTVGNIVKARDTAINHCAQALALMVTT